MTLALDAQMSCATSSVDERRREAAVGLVEHVGRETAATPTRP